jgi:hypothetical protein
MAKLSHLTNLRSRARGGDSGRQPAKPSPADVFATKVGWLAAWTSDGILIDFPDNQAGPLLAQSLVEWQPAQIQAALESRSSVLLTFEQGDECRPIIVGTMKPVPKLDPMLPAPGDPILVKVDGERLEISARDEIVLRCGESSITLRRNGRVVIKGAYVETRARGTNRIKGGNVLIN